MRFESSSRPVLRWAAGLAAVALMACIVWRAFCIGCADFLAQDAQFSVNSRLERGLPLDAATLEGASELLERAIDWNPDNSSAHENLALVNRMRLGLPKLTLVERDDALNKALAHSLRAAALRPTSGYTYSLVAIIKQQRGERDAIFHKALRQAVRYAPWEPGVQDNVIEAGSRAWDALDGAEREAIRETVRRALQTRPAQAQAHLLALRWILPSCIDLAVSIPGLCK